MRIWLPSLPAQRITFTNRFQNLNYVFGSGGLISGVVSVDRGLDVSGGGYVVFSARGAGLVDSLPSWSVYAEITVPAVGTERTVVACGHPTVGDRFELGVSAAGEMQVIGTSTVVSDDTVAAGKHKCLWVYTGGVIEFYVDGVRIGTEAVTLGSASPPSLFVGVAADGASRKWGSTIHEMTVYSYPLDESEAFQLSEIEGWTPRSLLSAYGGTFDDGMYWDGDVDGAYGLNDQPVILNPRFHTDTDWTKGAGWTIGSGVASHAAGSTSSVYQLLAIIGNRYELGYRCKSATGTGVAGQISNALEAYSTLLGRRSLEATAAISAYLGVAAHSSSDASVDDVTGRNLSCKQLNPYGSGTLAGDALVQATAASMLWKDSSGGGFAGDGTIDTAASGLSAATWDFIHRGGDCCGYALFKMNSLAGYNEIFGNYKGDGCIFRTDATKMDFVLRNDTGSFDLTGPAALAVDTWYAALFRIRSGATELWVDGVLVDGGTITVGTGAISRPFTAGARQVGSTVGPFNGSCRKLGVIKGTLSDANRDQIMNYLMRAMR